MIGSWIVDPHDPAIRSLRTYHAQWQVRSGEQDLQIYSPTDGCSLLTPTPRRRSFQFRSAGGLRLDFERYGTARHFVERSYYVRLPPTSIVRAWIAWYVRPAHRHFESGEPATVHPLPR